MPEWQILNTSRGIYRLQLMLPSCQSEAGSVHCPLLVHGLRQSPVNSDIDIVERPRQCSLPRHLIRPLQYVAHEYMTRLKNRLLAHPLRFLCATQGLSRASPCLYFFHRDGCNYSQETTTVVPSLRKKHARKDASSLSVLVVNNACSRTVCFLKSIPWPRTAFKTRALMLAFTLECGPKA